MELYPKGGGVGLLRGLGQQVTAQLKNQKAMATLMELVVQK
jgi:hypothetical protein